MATPFVFRSALDPGNPAHQRVTVPRTDLIQALAADIAAVRYPLIRGGRQMGKSTACLQLVDHIRREHPQDWLACYVDCQALVGASAEIAVSMLHNIVLTDALHSTSDETIEASLAVLPRPTTFYEFGLFVEGVAHALRSLNRLVLIVDEIESLMKDTLYSVLGAFRSFHHRYSRAPEAFCCCVIITCTTNIAALCIGPGSPYNIAWPHDLEEVSSEQWRAVLSQAGGVPFEEDALTRLFLEVGGQPYLLQRVSDRAVLNAQQAGVHTLNQNHVLDGVFWLFEMGDRHLAILSQEAEADPARLALCADLLRGHLTPFERIQETINDLADVGLIVEVDGPRLVRFRNRLYERLMLNLQYQNLGGPKGTYLREYGHLLVLCSEIQNVVLNEDLWKEISPTLTQSKRRLPGDIEYLVNACITALGQTANPVMTNLDVDFVNAARRYVLGAQAQQPLTRTDVLQACACLLVERWQCGGSQR